MKTIFTILWANFIAIGLIVCPYPVLPTAASTHTQLYEKAKAILNKKSASTAELEEALTLMQQAVELMPDTFKYAYNLGYTYARLEKWSEAEAWYKKARSLAIQVDDQKDTDIWIKVCSERLYDASVSVTASDHLAYESRLKVEYALKSAVMGFGRHRDRLERPTPLLTHIAVDDQNDSTLRTFFKNRFSGLNMIRRDAFLIIGPGSAESLDKHYTRGIMDAYRVFSRRFFTGGLKKLVVVLVDDNPHRLVQIVNQLYPDFNLRMYAPFLGLYVATDRLIVATVGAGYGTLLHELMHALVTDAYPGCPDWLDEGMATLFERSKWTPQRLVPLPNWRMVFIQNATPLSISAFDQMIAHVDKSKEDLAHLRLLLMFIDNQNRVDDLFKAQKFQGASFRFVDTLSGWGDDFSEGRWLAYAQYNMEGYRNEMRREAEGLSYTTTLFVQHALNKIIQAGLQEDGKWGKNTREKVEQFQQEYGLQVDGKVGPQTLAAIQKAFVVP